MDSNKCRQAPKRTMNEAGQTEGERDNANDAKNPKSLVMKHADNCDRRIEGERSDKSTFNEPPWRYEIRMSGERAEPEITNRPCLDTQHNRTKKENYSTHSVFSYWFHFCELEATPNVVYFGTAAMRWTNGAEFTSKTSWERFYRRPFRIISFSFWRIASMSGSPKGLSSVPMLFVFALVPLMALSSCDWVTSPGRPWGPRSSLCDTPSSRSLVTSPTQGGSLQLSIFDPSIPLCTGPILTRFPPVQRLLPT